ncbi:MAG: phytoene desaturase family protein [Planctomycetota bacterium]
MPKCVVVGGGFGGMASALRMRAKGYDVTLIDKQDKLGGRGYAYEKETEHGVFKHDAGPTVITAKFLFDELFELFGKKREDYVEFRDIYPWYRIVFAGEALKGQRDKGTEGQRAGSDSDPQSLSPLVPQSLPSFDYGGTMEQFEGQIRKFGGDRDVEGFRKYLAHSKKIFDKGFTDLGDQPFDKFTTMLKCAPDLVRLGCYKTVWQMGAKYIKDDRLRRVFSFQPLLVGGNPFNTTCIYSLIFYLEREWGVQFAMGGTGAIVRGLQRLMEEEGIEVRLGEEVCGIVTEGTSAAQEGLASNADVSGVAVGKDLESAEQLEADAVVCNGDPPHVYRELLVRENHSFKMDERYLPLEAASWKRAKIDKLKYSMGLFVLYFGTTRQYPDVAHHTIVLGEAYKSLLKKLFDAKEVEREDLSVYLHRPTATDPSMAPEGMDSFYVLVPVPNLQPVRGRGNTMRAPSVSEGSGADDQTPSSRSGLAEVPVHEDGSVDWDAFGDAFRDDVVRYLDKTVLPGLAECITGDFYVTPNHFRDNLNTHHGTGFSIQPVFTQSAWFRFHNKSDIDGLYFVGAGTHPGAGMPGVLCSAKLVDRLIEPVKSNAS